MSADELVRLAACATKSGEDAKRAEAHARACKVYAKKVAKEAVEINALALELKKIARQALLEIVERTDGNENINEVLNSFLQSVNGSNIVCDVTMLKALFNLDGNKMGEDLPELILNESQKLMVEQLVLNPQTGFSHADEQDSYVTKQACGSFEAENPFLKAPNILGAIPSSLRNNQQVVLGVATKRKSRRRTKARALGVPSPLLSTEEVTIVRRSTSPNPSQHSGMSPFVATQHRYSVRRKRSVTSQLTVTDDEERPQSPLATMTQPGLSTNDVERKNV